MSWLKRELFAIDVAGHRLALKNVHVVTVAVIVAIVAIVAFAAGWFVGGYTYPYRTTPRPPLPHGQKVPSSPSKCKPHVMGACLPKPTSVPAASITSTHNGVDFSNNNPVYSSTAWKAIAARTSFAIFKVTEGTGYTDPTAAPMVRQAKSHGLIVGGYDFLHVCSVPASSEATFFVSKLRADRLTGKRTLPPTGDAEYGGTNCNVRTWLSAWVATVHRLLGRWATIYTGAWWWNPHVGAWWPGSQDRSWISGYGVSYPYMPSGRSKLDMWQLSDAAFNGATVADLSVWRDGAAAFRVAWGAAPARLVCFGKHAVRVRACTPIKAKVLSQQNAAAASLRVYDREACPLLLHRDRYFSRMLKRYPHSTLVAKRRVSLAATRGQERKKQCGVLHQRYTYFTTQAHLAVVKYS